jgi:RHS repeat-associated protein
MSRSKSGWFACLVSVLGSSAAAKAVAVGVSVALLAGSVGGDLPRFPHRSGAGRSEPATPATPPGQRWAAAADRQHVVGKPGNKTLPVSMRGRYPAIQWRPEVNQASVVTGPTQPVRGYDAATSVAAKTQQSAYEKTYDNADGTQTTEFSPTPVNYRKPDGSWAPIDTTLVPVEAGGTERGWRNTADAVGVRLAGSASAPELATVTLDDSHAIAYSMMGVSGGVAEVAGSAVTYRGVASGVDMKLEVRPGGLKETIVLASVQAPASLVFPLRLTGLTARLDNGQVLLKDTTGTLRGAIPAGEVADAAGHSGRVGYELVPAADGTALKVTVDEGWLRSPERVFPVVVDPTVQVPVDGAAADSSMYVHGSGSASGSSQLLVGTVDGSSAASYVKFGSLVSMLQYHTIFGAKLWLVNYDADSCRPRQVTVHPVTGSWAAGTGYSYPGPAVGGSLASKSFAHGYIAFGQSSSACPTAGELLDLGAGGRDLVQRWVNGDQANYGLSLRASSSDALSGKRFAGTGTVNPPKLYVTHTPYYATYAIPNPVPNPVVLQNQDGKIKVSVTNKSAAAWAPSDYYLAYRAYNATTGAAVGQQRSANLTSTVARGSRVTLDATIKAMPPGKYFLDFTMVKSGGPVFTDYQVPPARLILEVFDIPPVVQELYPPNGYQAPTLTPQLWARALDIDAPPSSSLQFKFEVCDRDTSGNPVSCTNSGYTTKTAWTVPSGRLAWSKAYLWRTYVKDATTEVTSPYSAVLTAVPQPEITARLAGSPYADNSQDFDPQVGNYTTEALDASVATAGPELRLIRTYNSLDPRRDGLFGAGWTSRYDMKLVTDDDGSGNVVITYPDGQAVRFGKNADGTYAAPPGRNAALTVDTTAWKLVDSVGTAFQFSLTGRLNKITDTASRSVVLTYNTTDGKLAKAQVSNSQTNTAGRSLTFTWNGAHVGAVSTDAVNGSPLTWNYTYTGDVLTKVCAPGAACASYEYAAGSHYRSAVLDSRPESYWRLGEPDGTAAGSEIAVNLGNDTAVDKNVTLGQAGALTGTNNTAALFNGTTSTVDLPKGTLKKSRDGAVELWFKQSITGSGGPLLGYQDKALGSASTVGVPILYVGTDGKLRGQFAFGAISPITSGITVNDGKWHHVVLSSMATTETLYLDSVKVGELTGKTIDHSLLTFNQIGAAYASTPGSWPGWGSVAQRSFTGTIDEVVYYTHPIGPSSVAAHYKAVAQADQLAKVTLPSGKVAGIAVYDTDLDRIKEQTDADGGTWKIGSPAVYGGATDLRRSVEVLDPANRPSLYEYDAIGGWLLRLGQPLGLEARADDQVGEPTPSPSPSPTQTCSQPDPNDPAFCTTIPDDSGGPVFVRYDADGVSIRTFSYSEDGSVGTVTDENGDTVTMTYNSRGDVVSTKQCRTTTECHTSYATYPATITNPADPRNDLALDTRDGRSVSSTDTTYRISYTYHFSGQVASQTDPDGGVVTNSYTSGGEAAVGGGSSPAALLASTTDARGKITRYGYYANGDLATVTAPSGLVTSYSYDAIGRKITEKQVSDSFPSGAVTTYTYDGMGRPLTEYAPATTDAVTGVRHQQRTVHTYDVDGNETSREIADAAGNDTARITTYDYDEHNRPIRVTDAESNETEYGYDAFGNTTSMTDANGNRYDFAYTARNALAEVRLRDWHSDPAGAPPTGTGDYLVLRSYSYDLAGRQVSTTDAMGRRTENRYNHDGTLQAVVLKGFHNPDGSTRDFVLQDNTYDGAGNLVNQVTDNGKTTTQNTFDRVGRLLTTVGDPGGLARTTTHTYDLEGNITRTVMSGKPSNVPWVTSTTPEAVDYILDDAGSVKQETVTDGTTTQVTKYGYDQRGLLISSIDPRGNASGATPAEFTTTYRYDEIGNQTSVVGAPVAAETDGQQPATVTPTVTIGYNTFGEQAESKNQLGRITTMEHDKIGRLVRVIAPSYLAPGAMQPIQPVALTEYDGNGNAVEVTDARGNLTRTGYDQLNRVVSTDAPASSDSERAVWSYTYTRTGQPLSRTGPLGARIEATYDDLDRQVTATELERRPAAATYTTVTTYDDAGNVTKTVSPKGATALQSYDTLGQPTLVTDPNGVAQQFGYDLSGRQVRATDGIGRTLKTSYNLFGQKTGESDLKPDGTVLRTTAYRYDLADNLVAATDPRQVTTTYAYNAANKLIQQVEQVNGTESITTSYGYDAAGNRTRLTDGRLNSTITTYNSLGLAESQIEPATTTQPDVADRTWTFTYDASGNVVTEQEPGGVRRTSDYDAANRMYTETGAGAESTTATRTLKYDLLGELIEVNAASGTNTYSYDDRGNLLGTAGPGGAATFSYDGDGNRTSRTDAAGTSTYQYTKGRLSSVTDGITGNTQLFGYDNAGMLKTIGYGAGRTRTYTYDDLGMTAGDTLTNSTGATVAAATYRYDLNGRLATQTRIGTAGAGEVSYGYDDAGRLTSQTTGGVTTTYGWDRSGNRTTAGAKTAGYDERNRLLADGDYTYTYSARGTMQTRTSSGLTEQFSFDAFDRLITAAGQSYTYDGLDRVASRNGTSFTYAGLDDEIVGDGSALYARGPDEELLATGGAAAKRVSVSDRHGDVVGGFDPADGTLSQLADSTAYDPFGKVTAKSGSTGAIGFQGDWTDPGTGHVDMGARWYNPGTGGFASRDSVDTSGGGSATGNRYAYAGGDPLDRIDPDGHDWCSWMYCPSTTVVPCAYYIFCHLQEQSMELADVIAAQAAAQACQANSRSCGKSVKKPRGRYPSYAPGPAGNDGSVSCGSCYRVSAYDRAKGISDAARAAAAYDAQHQPLGPSDGALSPLLNMPNAVSSSPWAPAGTTGTNRDVVSDQRRGTDKIYGAAVDKAGPVVDKVSAASVTSVTEIVYTYTWTDKVKGWFGFGSGDGKHKPTKWAGLNAEAGDVSDALGFDDIDNDCEDGGVRNFFGCVFDVGTLLAPEVGVAGRAGRLGLGLAKSKVDDVVEVACAASGNSFTGDTQVRLAGGDTKPISEVHIGDTVQASDPTTGRDGAYEVTDVITGTGQKQLTEITVDSGGGRTASVTATAGHPFWVDSLHRWVQAGELQPGYRIENSQHQPVTVRAVRSWTQQQTVYNLTVDTLHTFYVVAGDTDLLVHNVDFRKCGKAMSKVARWTYQKVFTSIGRATTAAGRGSVAGSKWLYQKGLTPLGHGMTAIARGIGHGLTAAARGIGRGGKWLGRELVVRPAVQVRGHPRKFFWKCIAPAGGTLYLGYEFDQQKLSRGVAAGIALGCYTSTQGDASR